MVRLTSSHVSHTLHLRQHQTDSQIAELQITQEYLGQSKHLTYLAPYVEGILWLC